MDDVVALAYPELCDIPIQKILQFIRFASFGRGPIELIADDLHCPPKSLPEHMVAILAKVLGETSSVIKRLWIALKDEVWKHKAEIVGSEEEITLYNRYALPLGTSYNHIYPPVRTCQTTACPNFRASNDVRTLKEPRTYKATLFTLRQGTMPIYTTSLYCRGCNRRYHSNYSVHAQSNIRQYYPGVPSILQVSTHYFLTSDLLEFFTQCKSIGWCVIGVARRLSSSNAGYYSSLSSLSCARIYNESIGPLHAVVLNSPHAFAPAEVIRYSPPSSFIWQTSYELQDADVLNGFFLFSLLLDHAELGHALHLDHNAPSQKIRLKPALKERNVRMEGYGQEEYTHACDLCYIVSKDADGKEVKIQAAICDGNAIGHPCCAVHDCKDELVSHHARFCEPHSNLNQQCSVTDCLASVDSGFRTCSLPEHRALEAAYTEKGTSIFKLQQRLEKAMQGSNRTTSTECEGKPEVGNRRLKAYFGRRRTHNEQIIMRPCGVILSRATFYGSEAVSSVNVEPLSFVLSTS
ncbi:hypothetical protein CVT26_002579 [Gymnopilus dilepis]|uniref:CxC5 like cysteine cluster associated with KDZ domain-containing protein n=1 Tax=Gymnopilus dilepis TaxID=231916 RepID=A0A409VF34_9AGAR|nr:hypothetical protein CVT26_002579 [Gymnopilus dilepis]